MALGLGGLRLTPAAFWGMTLRELAAIAGASMPQALGRGRLHELMRRFPDG